jgi:hypothetical protein
MNLYLTATAGRNIFHKRQSVRVPCTNRTGSPLPCSTLARSARFTEICFRSG